MYIFFKYFADFLHYFQWFIGDQETAIVSTTIAKKSSTVACVHLYKQNLLLDLFAKRGSEE